MSRTRQWLLASALLAMLMGINWWINRGLETEPAPAVQPEQRIDYALYDFSARFYDERGEQTIAVHGPSLRHDALTRRATIEAPQFRLSPDESGWRGRARTGIVARGSRQLELEGAVRLEKPDPRGLITVETEKLQYDRDAGTAHAPGPAHLKQAGTELSGGTLTVWIDDERMEMDHDVRAIYRAGSTAAGDGTGIGTGRD